ncbi:MAG: protein-methionine-sulfoxide reductase catalytic subunit MsrP [Trueperaceae bacterium]
MDVIKRLLRIPSSEVTPEDLYLNRREFLRAAGIAATGLVVGPALGTAYAQVGAADADDVASELLGLDRTDEALTSFESVTTYNNFYEFGVGKGDPARNAHTLVTRPWTVTIDGEVERPGAYDLDDLLANVTIEERVYRMRCVEAWSMVIPWQGFMLRDLIARVGPTSSARYVAFTTLHDPDQMPGQQRRILDWPYVEGLRMDEAMHPLTILATGLYGRDLPNQNGAPLRLVVPWKYGFKSIKSIVRISFVEDQPPNTWNLMAPHEYGFYANVNPEVDHPRWSQASERRIGEFRRRDTLPFNGYGEAVADLYAAMDLRRNF